MRLLSTAGLAVILAAVIGGPAPTAQPAGSSFPTPVEGDFVARDFRFGTGETLPELTLHYRTVGTPRRDAAGVVRNAVLVLHGTGGTGRQFLTANFCGVLFGPGQLLDAAKYFIDRKSVV